MYKNRFFLSEDVYRANEKVIKNYVLKQNQIDFFMIEKKRCK